MQQQATAVSTLVVAIAASKLWTRNVLLVVVKSANERGWSIIRMDLPYRMADPVIYAGRTNCPRNYVLFMSGEMMGRNELTVYFKSRTMFFIKSFSYL